MYRLHFRYLALIMLGELGAMSTASAAIIPTNVSFGTPFHGNGIYTQHDETRADILGSGGVIPNYVVAQSDLSASLSTDRIDVSGQAIAVSGYFSPDFQTHFPSAGAGGSISFEIGAPTLFDIFWDAGGAAALWSSGFNPSLKITTAQGQVVVLCGGVLGCDLNPLDGGLGGFSSAVAPHQRFQLPGGAYSMDFSVATDHGAGVTVSSNFSASLREVPLPAGIWLMLSGFGMLGGYIFSGRARANR